jgi:tetratricopeptide (TPR) repeat protein
MRARLLRSRCFRNRWWHGRREQLEISQGSFAIRKFSQSDSILACLIATIFLGSLPLANLRGQASADSAVSGVSVEASQQVFSTMCALDAAGFSSDESTLAEMPSRLALRTELLNLQGPATIALREFYRDHLLADPGETLSRFMTFALVVGPPPRFNFLLDRDVLPPDALGLEGFQEILANFYHEAHLDLRWGRVEPEYQRAVARDQSPVRRIVLVSNAYLREIYNPKYGHTFTVYVEPLVGNRTNFRNNGNHYSIVIGANAQFPTAEVQHAFLHFMLDPLPLKYRDLVNQKKGILNVAARAPRLPVEYRSDFLAYADECLIKAVELRIRHLKPDELEAALLENDRTGFVMVRSFVTQLQKFEKAEPAMSLYFPDLLKGIDVEAERKRIQSVTFTPEAATPAESSTAKKSAASQSASPEDELSRLLAEGDQEIATQNPTAAAATFEKILAQHPDEPRAFYGLAVASLLSHDAIRAQELFEKLVSPPHTTSTDSPGSPVTSDPSILAWSHVYLGRLHDFAEERDEAVSEYQAALAVNGAPEAARAAATRGASTPYAPPASTEENPQKQ